MVKQNQITPRQQQPTNCLSVSDHLVELALKGLTNLITFNDFEITKFIPAFCFLSHF